MIVTTLAKLIKENMAHQIDEKIINSPNLTSAHLLLGDFGHLPIFSSAVMGINCNVCPSGVVHSHDMASPPPFHFKHARKKSPIMGTERSDLDSRWDMRAVQFVSGSHCISTCFSDPTWI
ncbi:hypothetical protein C0J52_11837 [Blattella germanica]|nr:hypothetical protein C0J52_11837 [Blattella germanica]